MCTVWLLSDLEYPVVVWSYQLLVLQASSHILMRLDKLQGRAKEDAAQQQGNKANTYQVLFHNNLNDSWLFFFSNV